jgi:hypothetical protein
MQCRYCYSSDPENDLIDPCNCQGSVKFVHQKCLDEWVHKSNKAIAIDPQKSEHGLTFPLFSICCELCNSEMRCYQVYQNTLVSSLYNTFKLSFMDYKNYPLLILHALSIYYIMNEVQFVFYYLIQLVYKPSKTKLLMKFLNETWFFMAVLWFTNDILKFYSNIYWEQRRVLMKFLSKNCTENIELNKDENEIRQSIVVN